MEDSTFIGSGDGARYLWGVVIQPVTEERNERKGKQDKGLASIDIIIINNNNSNNSNYY